MDSRIRTQPTIALAAAAVGAALTTVYWRFRLRDARRQEARVHRTLVDLLLNALSAGDATTERHSRRVADLADVLGREFAGDEERQATLRLAALLHDMGKIDDRYFHILHSCEPLSASERAKINEHPRQSADILEPLETLHDGIASIVEAHHECWDGNGYPNQLSGEDIPLASRIISVADVFDALTQPRPYHTPLSLAAALREIERGSGSRFDPQIVERLRDPGVLDEWSRIMERGRAEERKELPAA
jgi:HD-GYP domain-containing protein (c-di-GMP phosphodiesterase class II)